MVSLHETSATLLELPPELHLRILEGVDDFSDCAAFSLASPRLGLLALRAYQTWCAARGLRIPTVNQYQWHQIIGDGKAPEGVQAEQAGVHASSSLRPKFSGTRMSAAMRKLGTVATSTQMKKGT